MTPRRLAATVRDHYTAGDVPAMLEEHALELAQ